MKSSGRGVLGRRSLDMSKQNCSGYLAKIGAFKWVMASVKHRVSDAVRYI